MTEFTTWRSLVDGAEIAAIPDSEDLHSAYFADNLELNENDDVIEWQDQGDDSLDLTPDNNPPKFLDDPPRVEFEIGEEQDLSTSFSDLPQPYSIFLVVDSDDNSSSDTDYFFSEESGSGNVALHTDDDSVYAMRAMDKVSGGNPDADEHILVGRFDGDDSELRLDGSVLATGDVGGNDLNEHRLNRRDSGSDFRLKSVMVYATVDSEVVENVEEFLDKRFKT